MQHISFKHILVFILFLCLNKLTSQNYDVSTIAVNNNNQSASSTKKLYMDDEGFLWYSTYNGVVKEMGENNSHFFEYVAPKENDTYTFDLFKSSKNKLWSCTAEGINIIDHTTGKSEWITIKYPETDTKVAFTSIKEDSKGNIWLSTNKNYIYCYTNENELIWYKIHQSDYDSENNSHGYATEIKTILKDDSLILYQDKKWFHIKDGISRLIFDNSKQFPTKNNTSTILINPNSYFTSNSSGNYTYNNETYFFKYIKEINKHIVQVPYNNAKFISNDENQNFYKKINIVAIDETKLIALKFNKTKDNTVILTNEDVITLKNNITNFIYDKTGYFLLHTEAGISKVRYNSIGFKKYLGGKNISCRGISEDNEGNIYVFSYSGIFKLDQKDNRFKEIDNIKDTKTYKYIANASYSFFKENDTSFWFYGYHESLIKFNVNIGTFETYRFPKERIFITDIERISDSKLMLATSIGLYSFNLKTKTFKNESDLNKEINLNNINVVDLLLNKRKSALWVATKNKNHALVKIDYATGIISSYGPDKKGMPIINNKITNIYEDQKSNLWLGTLNGLEKINPINYISKEFTIVDGLSNDNISGILEDDNFLWVSSFNGLMKINKKTHDVQTFFKEDGIPNNEFNRKSFLKSSNGKLYFGGLDGIVHFDPKIISKNDRKNRIFLTEYQKYSDTDQKTKAYFNFNESISKFNIPYQQNYLTLKFAINDILDPDKNIYQYKINELSKDWVNLGNHNMLQLQGLKAGQYHLEVRGFSSNGNQTNTLKYNINVNQVFYKKFGFIALLILGLFGLFTIRNKVQETNIIKKHKRKIKINRLKYNAMEAQKNPRFLFETLNSLQELMIKKGEQEATKYFNVLSNFLESKIKMNDSEHVLINDEIDYLKSYLKLENLKLDHKVELKFEVDKTIETNTNTIPCMLFQPVIKDALVNGLVPKKYDLKLSLHFNIQKNNLVGEIIDNGVPRIINKKRNKNSKPQSVVTSDMEKRIELINSFLSEKIIYSIVDIKSEGEHLGTKSTLIIPLNNSIHSTSEQSEEQDHIEQKEEDNEDNPD